MRQNLNIKLRFALTDLNDCREYEHEWDEDEIVQSSRIGNLRQVGSRFKPQEGHGENSGDTCKIKYEF